MFRTTLALLSLVLLQGTLASFADAAPRAESLFTKPPLKTADARLHSRIAQHDLRVIDTSHTRLPGTPVLFDVDAMQRIRLEIVSDEGEVVRTLATGLWAKGKHQLAWHHDDDAGERVDDGVYRVRLSVEPQGSLADLGPMAIGIP